MSDGRRRPPGCTTSSPEVRASIFSTMVDPDAIAPGASVRLKLFDDGFPARETGANLRGERGGRVADGSRPTGVALAKSGTARTAAVSRRAVDDHNGARSPAHVGTSNPSSPDSANVGVSGRRRAFALSTPSALICPLLM